MKKIIPFKKDIIFNTNLAEITSISLEHTLQVDAGNTVCGKFIVSGDYKMSDTSVHTDPFSYDLPFDITLDEKYKLDKAAIDIDDFYYEIVNSNVLAVHIDVLVDRLEEILIPPKAEEKDDNFMLSDVREETISVVAEETTNQENEAATVSVMEIENQEKEVEPVMEELTKPRCIEPEDSMEEGKAERVANVTETVTSLFDQISTESETYKSYKVYIVRESDTLEMIVEKYGISMDEINAYNDTHEIKIGDKLIIPSINART